MNNDLSGGPNQSAPQSLDTAHDPSNGFPVPLDMTEILKYEAMVDEVTRVNKLTGPYYMQEFLKAINVASSFYTRTLWQYEQALVRSKATKGRLMLDVAPSALTAKGLRVNETNLVAYAESHPDYLAAKEDEAYFTALSEFMEQKVSKFERAHDDARKIFEAYREPMGQSGALSSGKDT